MGRSLGLVIAGPAIIWLYGELGAGKTAFVRGVAKGLGVLERVTSPTFALVNEYDGRFRLLHFDLYRLGGPDELLDIGWDDYVDRGGVLAVEWAERAGGLVGIPPPGKQIAVRFDVTPGGREITIDHLNP